MIFYSERSENRHSPLKQQESNTVRKKDESMWKHQKAKGAAKINSR